MSSPIPTHMPAMKVGGRRMSVGNRHKRTESTSKDAAKEAEATTSSDNPTAKEGEEQAETAEGQEEEQEEEEETKKKRDYVPDHAIKRDAKWTDNNSRRKNNTFGGGGRVNQPAGKGFAS